MRAAQPLADPLSGRTVLRRNAPRVALNGFGPLAAFYVGWHLSGLVVGIAVAALFGLLMYRHERRSGRPALIVRVALGLVVIRTVVGLATRSTSLYLGQEIIIDAALGSALVVSQLVGRPLAGLFAGEIFTFGEAIRGSATFRRTFATVTLVWGSYFLVRAAVRLAALLALSTDGYLLVAALSDAPFLIGLLAWSIAYSIRRFRGSEEWGRLTAASGQAAPSS